MDGRKEGRYTYSSPTGADSDPLQDQDQRSKLKLIAKDHKRISCWSLHLPIWSFSFFFVRILQHFFIYFGTLLKLLIFFNLFLMLCKFFYNFYIQKKDTRQFYGWWSLYEGFSIIFFFISLGYVFHEYRNNLSRGFCFQYQGYFPG